MSGGREWMEGGRVNGERDGGGGEGLEGGSEEEWEGSIIMHHASLE